MTEIAAVAAAASVLGTLVPLILAWLERRMKIRAVRAADFQKVLESNDIRELGRYLDNTLGQFHVREYVSTKEVASQIDEYMAKLEEYIGTSTQITEEQKLAPPTTSQPHEPATLLSQEFKPPFDRMFQELTTGERWNALARLRRHIEMGCGRACPH
ncbi:MAG: hypothetical protein IH989_08265 [Planctomycetes bacterium]|nr:hypothetical protein [Planctomycetota bacterium]